MDKRLQEILKQVTEEHREGKRVINLNDRVLIIDGLNTYIRVFSSVPALNDDGDHIGGVTGFLRSIASVIRQFKPTRCIIVFDGKGGSVRRKKVYSNYKANRANKTKLNRHEEFDSLEDEQASMKRQFQRVIQYLDILPVTIMSIDNIEADDAIAYLTTDLLTDAQKVIICSTDRDFLQLVDDRVNVWSPVKKKMYDTNRILEEFGIHASKYLLYRTFDGDKSDNIPGVDGIGLKTLIKEFPQFQTEDTLTTDMMLEHLHDNKKKQRLYNLIDNKREQLAMNHQLMQLKDVDIPGNTKLLIANLFNQPVNEYNIYAFKRMFMEDKMYTVIKDVDSWLYNSFATLKAYADKT
jgi:DNA polymerase-1